MFKLVKVYLKIGVLNELAYRANFWIQLFESILAIATSLGMVAIVFSKTENLAGWQHSELICLLGIYFVVLGSINFVIAPSLNKFMQEIVSGELDFTLTKPRDAQLLVSIQQFQIWKVIDILLGLAILAWGLNSQITTTSWIDGLMFGISLLCAGAIVYSFWMILATLAFWFIRIENITQIFWAMYIAGRWPIGIYPSWLKWLLTLVVPIAFAVTVPAEAVSGKLPTETLVLAVIMTAALLFISRRFWLFGLKHYRGASA